MSSKKSLPSRFFEVDGIQFEITGTEFTGGVWFCHVKNLSNGNRKNVEWDKVYQFSTAQIDSPTSSNAPKRSPQQYEKPSEIRF
jgi:hypothetical protein